MNAKQVKFIVLLTIAAFFIWAVGEVLIGLVFNLGGTASLVWAIGMVVATCVFSVWKCCRNDEKKNKNSRKW